MAYKPEFVWFDGKTVDFEKANVSILTHALHYGTGIFEGKRICMGSHGRYMPLKRAFS